MRLRNSGSNGLLWQKTPDPADEHWTKIGHARLALGLAVLELPGQEGQVFCVTRDAKLWSRSLNIRGGPWKTIVTGCGATTLTAVNLPGVGPRFFCTTADHHLYMRDAIAGDAPWQCIGDAAGVVALAALEIPGAGARLYCATEDHLLHERDAIGPGTSWKVIGDAAQVCGLAAIDLPEAGPHLFCATLDNQLYHRPLSSAASWRRVGVANNVVALAAARDRLLCVTIGERPLLRPLPHEVFLPVRKEVRITAQAWAEEPRRITISDEFGRCVGSWTAENAFEIEPPPYFAPQGSTPGVVVLHVLYERQFDGDPTWYGMRCKVSHRRGDRGTPEELTVAAEDCSVKFRWAR